MELPLLRVQNKRGGGVSEGCDVGCLLGRGQRPCLVEVGVGKNIIATHVCKEVLAGLRNARSSVSKPPSCTAEGGLPDEFSSSRGTEHPL